MIALRNVTLQSGPFCLRDVALTVPTGHYGVMMGRTGRGKTTILEAICGLRPVTRGTIQLGSQDMTHSDPSRRKIGYLPQDLALFPTLTVREHLEFALVLRRTPPALRNQRVEQLVALLGIGGLLDRRPRGLSGGERQRVALGRALSFEPEVLLLDEPLSSLDETTRESLQGLLKDIQRTTRVTTLHVTHSRMEALALADLVFVLEDGTIQTLSPSALRDLPWGAATSEAQP